MTRAEIDRLKKVYSGYQLDSAKQESWQVTNAGNRAILEERGYGVRRLLHESHILPLRDRKILEIGCGSGEVLAEFLSWGAQPDNLYGVDLMPDRINRATAQYPGPDYRCANAEALDFSDSVFDIVLLFTVFSSILDGTMQQNVSKEARRVLKKRGAVLWYDLRYNNPGNSSVRGITKRDIQSLFPGFSASLRTITLFPPLARRLGPSTAVLYPVLSRIPFLRTHYVGLLSRT